MKKFFTYLLSAIIIIAVGCAESYDDSKLWEEISSIKNRLTALEQLCKEMNTNISSLSDIVKALQNNDYVTNIAPITQDGKVIGYVIIFSKSGSVTIYHGKDGKDGANGANGADGKDGQDGKDGADGYTPVIGVAMDTDGVYYWTLDGDWLLDKDGNKVKAEGTDGKDGADGKDGEDGEDGKDGQDGTNGKDGQNGKDGITPKLKIENGYWLISYDNGSTWQELGKATGEDGKDGENGTDGDSMFKEVTYDDEYVYLTLINGSVITIPRHAIQPGDDSIANDEFVGDDTQVTVHSITSSCKGSYGDTVPENLIDGDMDSYYSAAGNISEMPVSLTCYFTDVDRVDYVDITPGRVYGKWGETDVYVTTAESKTEYLYGSYDFKKSGDRQRVTFHDGLINPVSVRFEIKTANMWVAGDGVYSPTLIAAHEIIFYSRNPEALDMLEYFTDESYSELKEGVTEEQIDAIENEFFRNLASDIYSGNYDLKYRAATYKPYPHPDVDMKRFRTSNYSLNDNVTGLYFEAGEHAVFVEETYGLPISLRVIDYQPDTSLPEDSSGWVNEDGHYYPLIKGQNKLNIKRRGLIYVMYHTEDPIAKPIKINFPTALINGYYDLADKSPEKVDWGTMLAEAKADHIDMVGEKSIFTLPVEWIQYYCNTDEKAKAVIEQADSIIFLQEQIQGHHKYQTGGHRNRMLYSSTMAKAFMFAGAYRTGYSLRYGKQGKNPYYQDGTINMLLNPKKFRVDGWGAYHEVGHCNQLPGFNWIGMAEVTNNFTAMYCAHFFIGDDYPKHKSDYMLLMTDDSYSNRYEAAWSMIANNGKNPRVYSIQKNPFLKLVPLWQLFLYNTLIMGREDFYPNVYHECRTGNLPDGSPNVALTAAEEAANDGYNNDGERQLNFIRLCCDAAKEDLTEFFYNWGFLTPFDGIIEDYGEHKFRVTQEMIDEVYEYAKKYPKPAKKNIWFINNHNLDKYRNGDGSDVTGFNIAPEIDECDGRYVNLYNGM